MYRAIGAIVVVLAFLAAIIYSENIKAAVNGLLNPWGQISVTINGVAQVATPLGVGGGNPVVPQQNAGTIVQAPTGESSCYYRAGFDYDAPSGRLVSAGTEIVGPGFFVPLRGPKAFFPNIDAVYEGFSILAPENGVEILYEFGTSCDLVIEAGYTPAHGLRADDLQ